MLDSEVPPFVCQIVLWTPPAAAVLPYPMSRLEILFGAAVVTVYVVSLYESI